MNQLPQAFLSAMQELLAEDYPAFLQGTQGEAYRGLSVNRLKITADRLLPLLPFETKKSPFYAEGYYITGDSTGIGYHPLHHAGAFYVQEPSATSAVALLQPSPGDAVLDLCAAPGGKSAQIASCLQGKGLLWSNEVVRSRAQILLSNMERMGVRNGVVSSCYPEVLCRRLSGFFDKVLVDAPCSGEGMFRKNPQAALEWSPEHVKACAERQLSILHSAAEALREGGVLVYSTCTFSRAENEEVISRFLEEHPEFEPFPPEETFGRRTDIACGVRITPLEGGEGHFAARLRKRGEAEPRYIPAVSSDKLPSVVEKALDDMLLCRPDAAISFSGNKVFFRPEGLPSLAGCGVIRAGIPAGELVKNRLEPAHALFMATPLSELRRVLKLTLDDRRVEEFLMGCEIDCDAENGYTAVAIEDVIVGFGKCTGGRLKNKYPKGLRQEYHKSCAPKRTALTARR